MVIARPSWFNDPELWRWHGLLTREASRRKCQFFARACVRAVSDLITEEPCRAAVETVERCLEGRAGLEEVRAASAAALRVAHPDRSAPPPSQANYLAASFGAVCTGEGYGDTAYGIATDVHQIVFSSCYYARTGGTSVGRYAEAREVMKGMEARQCEWLRDLLGDAFIPLEPESPWFPPGIVTIAEGIYEDERFHDLPILADALEEAGCPVEVFRHCREETNHIRGCWVLDLVLGRG
jgi:hypothetical protein